MRKQLLILTRQPQSKNWYGFCILSFKKVKITGTLDVFRIIWRGFGPKRPR